MHRPSEKRRKVRGHENEPGFKGKVDRLSLIHPAEQGDVAN